MCFSYFCKKYNHASLDNNSNWSQAKHAWVKKLLIRFGVLDMKRCKDPLKNGLNFNVSEQNVGLNIAGNANIEANNSLIYSQMNKADALFNLENQLSYAEDRMA